MIELIIVAALAAISIIVVVYWSWSEKKVLEELEDFFKTTPWDHETMDRKFPGWKSPILEARLMAWRRAKLQLLKLRQAERANQKRRKLKSMVG